MSVTGKLAERIMATEYRSLPAEAKQVSKHCLLDFIGVTVAGSSEPLAKIVREQVREDGGFEQAGILGGGMRISAGQAAMINGCAAHAHDYDDVHNAMSGHPTVPVAPAVLALAEKEGRSGSALLSALATGIDAECIAGRYVGSSHYAKGFHATATLGSLGAAAGCANLLGLDQEKTVNAIGIAATQAAGLKSMFGTMCKPFHAGKAAANGLLAAQLASRGFDSQPESLEIHQGFASTHSDSPSLERFQSALELPSFLPDTLFKYHAACYLTHSAMEAARSLRNRLDLNSIERIEIKVSKGHFSVCNIQDPTSGLEAKFSIRFATAMALSGVDTADIKQFSEETVKDPDLQSLKDKITVSAFEEPRPETLVCIYLKDGTQYSQDWNVAIPEVDLGRQWDKLTSKFHSLIDPLWGERKASEIVGLVAQLDQLESIAPLSEVISAAA